MEYVYTKANRLLVPEAYMYPPYAGRAFIESWRADRSAALDRWGVAADGKGPAAGLLAALGAPSWERAAVMLPAAANAGISVGDMRNTAEFLAAAVREAAAILTGSNEDLFRRLVRRFEVKKKLPVRFASGESKPAGEDILEPEPYANFSWLLGYAGLKSRDLRFVNCLLKVNDLLCSSAFSGAETTNWVERAALGVLCEMNLIAILLSEKERRDA